MSFFLQLPILNVIIFSLAISFAVSLRLIVLKKSFTIIAMTSIFCFLSTSYMLLLYIILLRPWHAGSVKAAVPYTVAFNLVLGKTIFSHFSENNYLPLVGNLLITFPLPIFMHLGFKQLSLKTVAVFSLLLVLVIEPSQLLINHLTHFPNHIIDIDDLLLNTCGCFAGVCLAPKIDRLLSRKFLSSPSQFETPPHTT